MTDPFDTVREWREQFIAVTDPLDLWLCIDGNYARPATKQETDIIAALASIEERLRELEQTEDEHRAILNTLPYVGDSTDK